MLRADTTWSSDLLSRNGCGMAPRRVARARTPAARTPKGSAGPLLEEVKSDRSLEDQSEAMATKLPGQVWQETKDEGAPQGGGRAAARGGAAGGHACVAGRSRRRSRPGAATAVPLRCRLRPVDVGP